MTDLKVTQADREAAANYHVAVGSLTGAVSFILSDFSDKDLLVQAFAAHRTQAIADLTAENEAWGILAAHKNWELAHGSWDWDGPQDWHVHSVNGSINDREWTLIGEGKTPAEAIHAAALKAKL